MAGGARNMMMFKYPAVVVSYDGVTRLAKVKLEPLDDGADTVLDAELLYPLGDKSNTAIEVLANDPVWVEFEAGDPRYPIIVGYRNKREGNDDTTRRYHHHGSFEILADNIIKIKGDVKVIVESQTVEVTAPTVTVTATTVTVTATNTNITSLVNITGNTSITGNLSVAGAISGTGGSGATIAGNVTVSTGDVVADGKSLKGHTHPYTDNGAGMTTGAPS
jgi:phage baseplate assembly protein gpV